MSSVIIIKLDDLKVGVKLPAPIYDANRKSLLLLNKGLMLTELFISQLRKRGIATVSVDATFADEIRGTSSPKANDAVKVDKPIIIKTFRKRREVDPNKKLIERKPVSEVKPNHSKVSAAKASHKNNEYIMGSLYETLKHASSFGKAEIEAVTLSSMEQLSDDMDVFVLEAIKASETGADHEHALRVSELAMAIATMMDVPEQQIKLLGLGCLLSRCGTSKKSLELTNCERKLTSVEMIEIQKNPSRTFDIMAKCPDLHMITRQVAYQINERWDGSGYPRSRSRLQIHPLARIASVSDAYVAMTTDRPHRKHLIGYSAVLEIIDDTKSGKFDPAVVRGLLQTISLFPLGSYVKLNNGEIGKVIRNTPEVYDRPTLLMLNTRSNDVLELSKHEDIKVQEVITDDAELANLVINGDTVSIDESLICI